MKRYTIHLSIYEVDADGDTANQEEVGITLDFATTEFSRLEDVLSALYEKGNQMVEQDLPSDDRRPEDDEDVAAGQSWEPEDGETLLGLSEIHYPEITVQLTGQDGNAFAILGTVCKALRKAGVHNGCILQYQTEATAGDYDELLQVTMQWVTVE